MNQGLMTLDFSQDTVIYEGQTLSTGGLTLAEEYFKVIRGIPQSATILCDSAACEYQADCDGDWGEIVFDFENDKNGGD